MDPFGGGKGAVGSLKLVAGLGSMLLSRRIDWTDTTLLNQIRIAYYVAQVVGVLVALYLMYIVRARKAEGEERVIYVRPPPVPLVPPQPYKQTTYAKHESEQARALLQQFGVGMAITSVLHWRFSINQALILQTAFMPLTLYDHALVRKYILGTAGDRIYEEKFEDELTPEELAGEVTEESSLVTSGTTATSSAADAPERIDALMGKAWDDGEAAELVGALDAETVNCRNITERWTPLMVVSGLSKGDFTPEMGQLVSMGADPFITDDDGWTCLHWASFHANVRAVAFLTHLARRDKYSVAKLWGVKDTDGKTALAIAKVEATKAKAEDKAIIAAKLADVVTLLTEVEMREKASAGAAGSVSALD